MHQKLTWVGTIAIVGLAACSAQNAGVVDGSGSGGQGGGAGGGTAGAGAVAQGGNGQGGDGGLFGTGPTGAGGGNDCASGPDEDQDMDGFSFTQGDCNDCDANVNPGAVEVMTDLVGGGGSGGGGPGVPVDEDCDGLIDADDSDLLPCDAGLAVDAGPIDGARAMDICKMAGPTGWGLVDAKWVLADGSPPPANANFDLGHGVLSGFGPNVNVQRGERMLAVSSGTARQPTDPGYQPVGGFSKGYSCTHPQGFPKESPSCGVAVTGTCYDAAALEIKVRAPTNAQGFSFNFNFFTYEWPGFVCSQYNDFFTAILSPVPAGQTDGSITFDNLGNPVSVNNAFVDVCGCSGGPPCSAGGKTFACSLGTDGLLDTGFGDEFGFGQHHGSTSWLLTTAPVTPGAEISLRFVAYDSGDGSLDSTGLVDNFAWIAEPGTQVGTTPIPDPE